MAGEAKEKIIFFGNGPLADAALAVLEKKFEIVFHAREKADLLKVKELKANNPGIHGVLASFGVIIREDVLELFEPEGILNIHPSLLPAYRGASPIESAILAGDTEFSVSIMKLVRAMDAGPIYYQRTFKDLPLNKAEIYRVLASDGAEWIAENLTNLPEPMAQDDEKATFTTKFSKSDALIDPSTETAEEIFRKIVAFQGFPKVKFAFYGIPCIILEAKVLKVGETAPLVLECARGSKIAILRLQPENRKPMDVKSFLNGYVK
ncbi:MAG: formyltransferase family protein [Candidatus Saccharibacteria bacterium]|nr:formyltransferase family protein [Candidatus Saccharibacteria bacterium]